MVETIYNIKVKVLRAAQKREDDAGYGGYPHDGGAGRLRDQLEMFLIGIRTGSAYLMNDSAMVDVPSRFVTFMD